MDQSRTVRIVIESDDGSMRSAEISPAALKMLGMVSCKHPTVAVSEKHGLTTYEDASYMHVSRLFLIKELEEGKMPYRKVGTHRRIVLKDVEAYKQNLRT